jgi:IS30 family transposase
LVRLVELREAVIEQLKEGWSPEQIAGRLQFEGQSVRVSHGMIYAYVYGPDGQSKELARYLPNRRKKRRPNHSRRPRGLFFRRIVQSMNDLTTSKPARHLANGRAT